MEQVGKWLLVISEMVLDVLCGPLFSSCLGGSPFCHLSLLYLTERTVGKELWKRGLIVWLHPAAPEQVSSRGDETKGHFRNMEVALYETPSGR